MDTSELLKKVRRIEIKTRGLSKHLFSGEYHSAFKGRGMSFSEVRDYQYGDDIRNIDWNVTARTGNPHIKIFEEERELTVMLLIDMSGSSYFGTKSQLKHSLLTELSAVIAFSATSNNDKVGAIFFTDQIEMFIPPRKGRQQTLRLIRELLDLEPKSKGTNIGAALEYFNNVIKKRSIAFLLSDFLCTGYETPLRIASRRHDLIGIHLMDPAEATLPDAGLIRIQDPELGNERWMDTSSRKVRAAYEKWHSENEQYFKSAIAKSGAQVLTLHTNKPYTAPLLQFFKRRSGS